MPKPEATFINSIHRHLPPKMPDGKIDYLSMAGTYTSGIADVYYDGPKCDLWVEYKYIEQLPKRMNLLRLTTKPLLTALQNQFLCNRQCNGHLAWVIVGCKDGGIILSSSVTWRSQFSPQNFILFSRKELANNIVQTIVGYLL